MLRASRLQRRVSACGEFLAQRGRLVELKQALSGAQAGTSGWSSNFFLVAHEAGLELEVHRFHSLVNFGQYLVAVFDAMPRSVRSW